MGSVRVDDVDDNAAVGFREEQEVWAERLPRVVVLVGDCKGLLHSTVRVAVPANKTGAVSLGRQPRSIRG